MSSWLALLAALPLAVMVVDADDHLGLAADFERQGFVVIQDFVSDRRCEEMQARMRELVSEWDPEEQPLSVFRTDEKQTSAQGSDDYFLDSADRIHFFLEPNATAADGRLRPGLDKQRSLNKVGHGLHVVDPVFSRYANSARVARVMHALGWSSPELPQSMYIFKQPQIGGPVTPHQDSSFLFTTPRTTCLGLWLALEDADQVNGCLWARPGSHREPVRRRFVRNPSYFEDGNKSSSMMMFLEDHPAPPYDANLLDGPSPDPTALGFVPLPVKRGTLIVLHGSLDHLSLPNTSPRSRHTFQLHAIEGREAGITWADSNWLQYKNGEQAAFPKLRTASAMAPPEL